jgi:hypothetical protein|nr:MAG TPA: hypothetical protein [Caudoviricetes sp.]
MEGIEKMLHDGLEKMREGIISKSREAGQEASGKTYASITVETNKDGETIVGAIYAPNYFHTLLVGRGPGKVPANMGQLIMEWAAAKGITFQTPKDAVRFGNAVAWKIRREGSELYRNHLYVDIIDTPAKEFEEWLNKRIGGVMDVVIERAFTPDETGGHGFII